MTRSKTQGWQAYQVLKCVDISTVMYQPSRDLFFLILYSKKQGCASLQHMPTDLLICNKLRAPAHSPLPSSPLPLPCLLKPIVLVGSSCLNLYFCSRFSVCTVFQTEAQRGAENNRCCLQPVLLVHAVVCKLCLSPLFLNSVCIAQRADTTSTTPAEDIQDR